MVIPRKRLTRAPIWPRISLSVRRSRWSATMLARRQSEMTSLPSYAPFSRLMPSRAISALRWLTISSLSAKDSQASQATTYLCDTADNGVGLFDVAGIGRGLESDAFLGLTHKVEHSRGYHLDDRHQPVLHHTVDHLVEGAGERVLAVGVLVLLKVVVEACAADNVHSRADVHLQHVDLGALLLALGDALPVSLSLLL